MNVDTGSFRALSDQAARADEHRENEQLLIRALAAEISGGHGPLASDDVARYLCDAVVEQGQLIAELRAPLGTFPQSTLERHLRAVK